MTSSFIEQLLLFSDSIAHYFVTKVNFIQKSHLLLLLPSLVLHSVSVIEKKPFSTKIMIYYLYCRDLARLYLVMNYKQKKNHCYKGGRGWDLIGSSSKKIMFATSLNILYPKQKLSFTVLIGSDLFMSNNLNLHSTI